MLFLLYGWATCRNIDIKGEFYDASYIKKEIQNLGEVGDIINVKDGYARNFLLPQGAAEIATAGALENREKISLELKLNKKITSRSFRKSCSY